jgi:hypothetical protein
MSKHEAILHAEGVQQTAHSLRNELERDTLDTREVRIWLEWIEDELAKLKKALGEIGIGT